MKEMIEFLAKHGYWLLFVSVLGRQACLPVPANLLLLAGGALAGLGRLSVAGAIAFSVTAFLLADLAWYRAGRKWGSRALHFVCGPTRDPSASISKIAKTFSRHGVKSLLISKFIPGLDAVAAPMSGISGVTLTQFLTFDVVGALLWSSVYTALGYAFCNQLDHVAAYIATMGRLLVLLITVAGVAGLVALIVRKLVRWYRFLREFRLARISPDELRKELSTGKNILVLDLQGDFKRDHGILAIPGAVRIDPGELSRYIRQYRGVDLSTDREVVLYCDCPSETSSARVALALRRLGFERVRPLAGGFPAWRELGFPVSPDVQILPLQERRAYLLRVVLQLSGTHAAQILKTNTANVDQLLQRALKRLRSANIHQFSPKHQVHPDPINDVAAPAPSRQVSAPE